MKSASSNRRYSQGARAQSTEATGQRIVDAFLARLMTQWYDEITLDRVAAAAGVTVQTVVRRFGSKEGLLADAVKTLARQIEARRATPPGDSVRLVKNLIEDYEKTGDAVIRLLALEPRHVALKEFLDVGRRYHREWVAGLFASDLARLTPAPRKLALDALVIITDVYTWKLLRRDLARSLSATETTLICMIRAALVEFFTPNSPGDA